VSPKKRGREKGRVGKKKKKAGPWKEQPMDGDRGTLMLRGEMGNSEMVGKLKANCTGKARVKRTRKGRALRT